MREELAQQDRLEKVTRRNICHNNVLFQSSPIFVKKKYLDSQDDQKT